METPNLFDFATKELSQDAFKCWLASWANPLCRMIDNSLHQTATLFLESIIGRFNIFDALSIARAESHQLGGWYGIGTERMVIGTERR